MLRRKPGKSKNGKGARFENFHRAADPYVNATYFVPFPVITAIRTGEPLNEAIGTAESTLMGIMGRNSAYTGLETTWEETLNSKDRLGPETYQMGPVNLNLVVPVPGTDKA